MICPKCNAEYRDEFTVCSDCGVDLVKKTDIFIKKSKIVSEGIRLIKFGIILLFVALTEMMIVVLACELSLTYMKAHGYFMDYDFINLINPILRYIFAIEIVISLAVIIWGISFRKRIITKSKHQ